MPRAPANVFLSYCRDDRDAVVQLRHDLTGAGFRVWWDQDILPGQDWGQEIRRALRRCDAFVVCLSRNLEARERCGAYEELLSAIRICRELNPRSASFIFPVRLSDCEVPDIEVDGTRTLDRFQCVDLFPPSKRAEGLRWLIEGISAANPRIPRPLAGRRKISTSTQSSPNFTASWSLSLRKMRLSS